MSAGGFSTLKYQRNNDGLVHPIKVQPETSQLVIGTFTNTPPTGATGSDISARSGGGNREFGLKARSVTIKWTTTPPEGYKEFQLIRLPIFREAMWDGIAKGNTGTYLTKGIEVVGKSPERANQESMAGFQEAVKNAARESYNNLITGASNLWEVMKYVGGDSATQKDQLGRLIRYLAGEDGDQPLANQPYTGGQCVGTQYIFNYRVTDRFGNPSNLSELVTGRLGAIREQDVGTSRSYFLQVAQGTPGAQEEFLVTVGIGPEGSPKFEVLSVVPVNNGPDNCGDPAPIVPPPPAPNFNTYNKTINYTDNSGQDHSTNINIKFGYYHVDAGLKMPITVNVGGINLNGNIDINGSVVLAPKVAVNFGRSNPDGEPGCSGNAEECGEPPENDVRLMVGVLVTVTNIGDGIKATQIFQSGNPDIFAPKLGHINFLTRVGRIAGGWSADIPVKNRRQFIPCPFEWGASAVEGTPEDGVEWVLTPIYALTDEPAYPVFAQLDGCNLTLLNFGHWGNAEVRPRVGQAKESKA